MYVTGADQGVLEPCGCSGGQLGGISRRATLLSALHSQDNDRLVLSVGGLPGGINALHRIRYEIILLCLAEMSYDAAGLCPEELNLGLDAIRDASELVDFPFLLSNVNVPNEEEVPFQRYLMKNMNGCLVRILSFISESHEGDLPDWVEYVSPQEAMDAVAAETEEADLTLILFRGDRREAKSLDSLLPDPKLILYSYPHSEPQVYDFGKREGEIKFLSPGDRGRFLIWCRISLGDQGMPTASEPVQEPLELHYPESDVIQTYMEWYKERVIGEDVLAGMVELLPAPKGSPYLGGETCILCHEKACATWTASTHSHAYKTLIDVNRAFDPECVSCHSIGFGFKTGFRGYDETPGLVNVGCESCHGPCSDHVESAGTIRTPLRIDCKTCHTLEHSTGFLETEYWVKIKCTADEPLRYKHPDEESAKAKD
ncbi:MAG: multiheme c-type cytochrome [Planctomycetota bacterium]